MFFIFCFTPLHLGVSELVSRIEPQPLSPQPGRIKFHHCMLGNFNPSYILVSQAWEGNLYHARHVYSLLSHTKHLEKMQKALLTQANHEFLSRKHGREPAYANCRFPSLECLWDVPLEYQISVPVQPGIRAARWWNQAENVRGVIVARLDDLAALVSMGRIPQNVEPCKNLWICSK